MKCVSSLEDKLADCVACQYSKQTRKPFPQTTWKSTHKLQLVHTNVGGPQKTSFLNGSKYYVVFIDEYTRFCWKYKALVENQSGCRMQKIRSDNGKEYTNDTFDKFCEEAGIEHQLTTHYTPRQNGVSERKNRTIMEMTRCMLYEKEMPKKLWPKAANTVVCFLNRLPTRVLQKKNPPFEVWFGYKPNL